MNPSATLHRIVWERLTRKTIEIESWVRRLSANTKLADGDVLACMEHAGFEHVRVATIADSEGRKVEFRLPKTLEGCERVLAAICPEGDSDPDRHREPIMERCPRCGWSRWLFLPVEGDR